MIEVKTQISDELAEKLAWSTALMVEYARNKDIDVLVWLAEGAEGNERPIGDFERKLISLGQVVAADEDENTQHEIKLATSKESLESIYSICECKSESGEGNGTIDVSLFVVLCERKFRLYLATIDADFEEEPETIQEMNMTGIESAQKVIEPAKAYIESVFESTSSQPIRPGSAPTGRGPLHATPRMTGSSSRADVVPVKPYDRDVDLFAKEPKPAPKRTSAAIRDAAKRLSSGRSSVPTAPSSRASSAPRRARQYTDLETSRSCGDLQRRSMSVGRGGRASMNALSISVAKDDNPSKVKYLQDLVDDLARNAVRQADLYHLIQVHLGFIEPYTLVPPRGQIINSTPRPWLTTPEIKSAFLAGRVRMTDSQIVILMKNVQLYAVSQQRNSFNELDCEDIESNKLVIHHGKLNAFWLQRYLIHLRLSKRSLSVGHKAAAFEYGLEHTPLDQENANNVDLAEAEGVKLFDKLPIDFDQWLEKKEGEGKQKLSAKSTDFRRALAGKPHSLSKEEISLTLERMDIVPPALMEAIIKQKVQAFVLDANGRRDYQWQLKNEVIKWEKANGSVWAKVLPARKAELRAQFRDHVIAEKTSTFFSSERSSAAVTKEIFWKYDNECKSLHYKGTIPWGQWVQKYIDEDERKLAALRQDTANRRALAKAQGERQRAVASLVEVEDKLKKAAESLASFHSIELRKCLIALKRAAASAKGSEGKNVLVSKQEFDRHVRHVLVPRLRDLPDDLKYLAEQAYNDGPSVFSPKSKPKKGDQTKSADAGDPVTEEKLFSTDESALFEKVVRSDEDKEVKRSAEFKLWLHKKREAKLDLIRLQKDVDEQKDKEKLKREKESKKAYKLWLKMHNKNKYISKVDGKAHAIPFGPPLKHQQKWHVEVDPANLPSYTPKEKKVQKTSTLTRNPTPQKKKKLPPKRA